jgi:serine/threonine protein kinase
MALPFGKFQLLKKLAAGGMGQVFLARADGAQGFEKMLVIKRILPHLVEDDEFIQMFFDEARLTARLNHPNIVQIFELGEVGGSHYLAMEYVAGEDLRRMEREATGRGRPLPLGAACRIVSDAAAGLDYAHKARDAQGQPLGIIHRDVSPQNILVGFDGGVKLIDFGVARAAGRASQTATGILKGKYAYMSPEQVDGLEIDHRSDIFALGVVFWEVLTGKRLFKGDSDVQTMRLVRECSVPPPSRVNAAVPGALDPLVAVALARDAARRYPDAAAFRMAIEDFVVAQRLAASSAHLVAFLKDLYGSRIDRESQPDGFDVIAPTDVLDEIHTPSSGPPSTRTAPEAAPPPVHTGSLGTPTTPRWTRWGAAALVAGLAALGGGLAARRMGAAPATPPAPVPRADSPATAPPPPPPAPAPAREVALTLVSDPSGARVQLDGRDIGITPVSISAPSGGAQMTATFSLPGFESMDAAVSASDAPLFSVQLKKKAPAPAKNAVHLGIKTGR